MTTSQTSAASSTTCDGTGASRTASTPDSYESSQRLGQRLLDRGSLGVVYPSVRRTGGTCLACFRPAVVGNVRRDGQYAFTFSDAELQSVKRVGL